DLVTAQSLDFALVDGRDTFVGALDDIDAAARMLRLQASQGTLQTGAGEIILDDRTASNYGLAVGDSVRILLARTGEQTMRVVGIYERTPIAEGILISTPD